MGRDLVKKRRRYEDLKFGRKGGVAVVSFVAATFETHVIYSGGRMVINYRIILLTGNRLQGSVIDYRLPVLV